jgi:hypothetical protein
VGLEYMAAVEEVEEAAVMPMGLAVLVELVVEEHL